MRASSPIQAFLRPRSSFASISRRWSWEYYHNHSGKGMPPIFFSAARFKKMVLMPTQVSLTYPFCGTLYSPALNFLWLSLEPFTLGKRGESIGVRRMIGVLKTPPPNTSTFRIGLSWSVINDRPWDYA